MSCLLCGSANQAEFTGEMMIHFSGLKHLANPGVLVFPKLLICLNCGFSRFRVSETELASLVSGNASGSQTPGPHRASSGS